MVVCCANLFIVSNYSNEIGDASVDVDRYTFSLPLGFSLYNSDTQSIVIVNPNSQMKINVFVDLKKEDTYEKRVQHIGNGTDNILSNGTITYNNISISALYYQSTSDYRNFSTFYFSKYNHTHRILISNFDYNTQKNETIDIASKIINSFRVNYKNG